MWTSSVFIVLFLYLQTNFSYNLLNQPFSVCFDPRPFFSNQSRPRSSSFEFSFEHFLRGSKIINPYHMPCPSEPCWFSICLNSPTVWFHKVPHIDLKIFLSKHFKTTIGIAVNEHVLEPIRTIDLLTSSDLFFNTAVRSIARLAFSSVYISV